MESEKITLAVSQIPSLGNEINEIRSKTANLVTTLIIPNELLLRESVPDSDNLRAEIINKVKQEGLWAPHLPEEYGGWA